MSQHGPSTPDYDSGGDAIPGNSQRSPTPTPHRPAHGSPSPVSQLDPEMTPQDRMAAVRAELPREEQEGQLSTFGGVLASFLDLLECALHTILCERGVYPREIFLPTRKYGCPVKMCRAPRVCEYVRHVVDMVGNELLEGNMQAVSIVITTEDLQPLERFVFDVSSFPRVERRKMHALLIHEPDVNDEVELPGTAVEDLHQQFRAIMNTLAVCSARLGRLPEEVTWCAMAEVRKDPKKGWTLAEQAEQREEGAQEKRMSSGKAVRMLPVRTVEVGALNLGVWIEESKLKSKMPA